MLLLNNNIKALIFIIKAFFFWTNVDTSGLLKDKYNRIK